MIKYCIKSENKQNPYLMLFKSVRTLLLSTSNPHPQITKVDVREALSTEKGQFYGWLTANDISFITKNYTSFCAHFNSSPKKEEEKNKGKLITVIIEDLGII